MGAVVAAVLLTSGGGRTAKGGGDAAPVFTLPNLEEGKGAVSLASYRGTPVLVNFWATWCTPCVHEMPMLEAAHQRFGSKVQFIGIDRQDYRPDALAFVQRTHPRPPASPQARWAARSTACSP